MNHTTRITDCQDAIRFVPINSLVRSHRNIHFFSRVSKYGQDHRKYIAALQAAHRRLRLPMPFTWHEHTGNGQLDGDGKYFTWFSQEIPNTESVVCVFPAMDRLFRPTGFDQLDPTTWQYQESDFELFRKKLADLGLNPENITFALLNDGTLESDRAFETRLGKNYNTMHNTGRIDPETSERLQNEVRELRTLGMTVPDICFHLAVRLERVADRTVRGWYQTMGFPTKWDDIQHEVHGLAVVEGMNAAEIHRHFQSHGKEIVTLRTIQDWLQGTGFSSKRGKPKSK